MKKIFSVLRILILTIIIQIIAYYIVDTKSGINVKHQTKIDWHYDSWIQKYLFDF